MADMTVLAIQKLQPAATYKKYNVSPGLFVGVASTGEKTFIVRYSVNGKQVDYRLPKPFGLKSDGGHMTLLDARAKAAEIKAKGKQGTNYEQMLQAEAEAAKAKSVQQDVENYTVNDLYAVWFPTTRRKDGGADLIRYFNRYILPVIGTVKLRDIEERHIRELLSPIASKGTNRTAVVTLSMLKQMFGWADGRRPWKLLVDDPTCNLKPIDVTQPDYDETERDRVLSHDEIKDLVRQLPSARLIKTSEAVIWLTMSCCTRVGETLKAEWKHINFEDGSWFIPEANTKAQAPEHTVYLSAFAIRQFEALKAITGHSKWCFPNDDDTGHINTRSPTKQITDRQTKFSKSTKPLAKRTKNSNSLVLGTENWTPHDLRRTGATLMQSLGVEQHIIERVINHAEQNRMQRIYQRHDYAAEQRDGWAKLGALLDSLVVVATGATVEAGAVTRPSANPF